MNKDTTYQEKIVILSGWLPEIFQEIKKDLKKDHWQPDPLFVKKYFSGKPHQKIPLDEIVEGYRQAVAIEEKGEDIAEFIATRWLLKHTDVYDFFEKQLSQLKADFTTLEQLDKSTSEALSNHAIELFGATNTYIFAVFNSVVFTEAVYDKLRTRSLADKEIARQAQESDDQRFSLEQVAQRYELQLSRLSDRYEKRLSGMERKYLQDTQGLKKQIKILQQRLDRSKA